MSKAEFTNKRDKKRNSKIIKGKKVTLPKEKKSKEPYIIEDQVLFKVGKSVHSGRYYPDTVLEAVNEQVNNSGGVPVVRYGLDPYDEVDIKDITGKLTKTTFENNTLTGTVELHDQELIELIKGSDTFPFRIVPVGFGDSEHDPRFKAQVVSSFELTSVYFTMKPEESDK